ncbi:hypothetical protein [Lyngbya confervoides]|uniref:Uncharacterized protein n=1 Tax=Lyngbya confervoides BDU141951 TaxID=1574623 RepID=A0ABD4SY87_9CYAN|nr:hypothetical protein [Lyngbya confervoides]MCM1981441.1 hypothetical protein [Lyngbya confervoides BDU141951]
MSVLLREDAAVEPDEERLYTDEFIRANEKASRSLFLGFLGLALLGTAVVAWFVLSNSSQDDPEAPSEQPVQVPAPPPVDFNLEQSPVTIPSPVPGAPVESGDQPVNSTQPPVFPANPPDSSTSLPQSSPIPGGPVPSPQPDAQPEGTLPPAPPVQTPSDSE